MITPVLNPANFVLDGGQLLLGSASAVIIGAIEGGITFDDGREMRQMGADGLRVPLAGMDRILAWKPTLSMRLKEVATADISAKFVLGGAAATVSGVTTITPPAADGVISASSAQYLSDLRAAWPIAGGNFFCIYFPTAVCTRWLPRPTVNGELTFETTFEARALAANLPTSAYLAPYKFEIRTALP